MTDSPDQSMTPFKRSLLTAAVMVATLMQVLDTSIANIALPHMQAALNATQESVTWVLTSYMLAMAVMTPLTGTLDNWIGRRNLFTICVGGFTLASAICGAAPNLTVMVLARIAQGIFGSLLLPLSQTVMLDVYPADQRAKAMTIWSTGTMIGPISGPFVGGLITENFSWRWVFYVNVPFGIICTLALWLLLSQNKAPRRRFDVFGFVLLATALATFQLMLDRGTQKDWFDSPEIILEAGVAAASFWMFLIHTMTDRSPLLPRSLFMDRNFIMAIGLMLGVVGVMYSSQTLIPVMMQQLLHYNTQQAGLLMMPRSLGMTAAMVLAGRFATKINPRAMIIGALILLAYSQHLLTGMDLMMDSTPMVVAGTLQGIATGFIVGPLTIVAYSSLPSRLRTDATAVFSMCRNLSASVAIAIMGALVARNLQVSHSEIGAHLTESTMPVLDPRFIDQIGHAGGMVAAMVDAEINRQAMMIAYLDDFWLMMWSALIAVPVVLLLRPARLSKLTEPEPAPE
jgi:DHA2 family multidrug resistance protein